MERRAFVATVTASILVGPLAVEARPTVRVVRVGVLRPAPDNPVFRQNFEGFRQRLSEQGYAEGQNLRIEYRLAAGPEAVDDVAAELVRSKPDVIVALAPAGVVAARKVTTTIPIVAV